MKFYLNDDNNNKNSIFLIGIQKRLKSLGGYKKIMHKCGTVLVNFFAKERISSSLEQDNKSSRSLTASPNENNNSYDAQERKKWNRTSFSVFLYMQRSD